jgi:hypothetical protein
MQQRYQPEVMWIEAKEYCGWMAGFRFNSEQAASSVVAFYGQQQPKRGLQFARFYHRDGIAYAGYVGWLFVDKSKALAHVRKLAAESETVQRIVDTNWRPPPPLFTTIPLPPVFRTPAPPPPSPPTRSSATEEEIKASQQLHARKAAKEAAVKPEPEPEVVAFMQAKQAKEKKRP